MRLDSKEILLCHMCVPIIAEMKFFFFFSLLLVSDFNKPENPPNQIKEKKSFFPSFFSIYSISPPPLF